MGSNTSSPSSDIEGCAWATCALMPRCTEALTCVDVDTSLEGSNALNIVVNFSVWSTKASGPYALLLLPELNINKTNRREMKDEFDFRK